LIPPNLPFSSQPKASSCPIFLFTGNANPELARKKVAAQLHIPLGDALVGRFSDGEIQVEIKENVRGKDVFIIQPPARRPMTT
jgi:phosphoribosylpyrophosphate synthetase